MFDDSGEEDGPLEDQNEEKCYAPFQKCCDSSDIVKKSIVSTPNRSTAIECGVRNRNGSVVQIVNLRKDQTQFSEFPWMVAIMKNDSEKSYFAGGSIVRENVILTGENS